jgi:hypothetical protein
MPELTKGQKRKLRELNALAYARELETALAALERDFAWWRAGKIDPFELSDRIHAFHDGVSRDLWKTYEMSPMFAATVRDALERKVLSEAEVPPEVLALL